MHFIASIDGYDATGNFVYQNSLIPHHIFDISLGDYGVNLFFFISGAALAYTRSGSWGSYYRKRAKSLFPMYWIALFCATSIEFIIHRGIGFGENWEIIISALGLDGYFMLMGWDGYHFYQVGEWFLGCIILIYLFFPIVYELFRRNWLATAVLVTAITIGLSFTGIHQEWFFLKYVYIVLGMVFVTRIRAMKNLKVWAVNAVLAAIVVFGGRVLNYSLKRMILTWITFCAVELAAEFLSPHLERYRSGIEQMSALTFPIYLVHHKILYYLVPQFDLETIQKREVCLLYFLFIALSVVTAAVLKWSYIKIRTFFAGSNPDEARPKAGK